MAICSVAPFAAGASRLGARLDRRSPCCWADVSSPWQPESWDERRVYGLAAGREEFPPLCSLLITAAWCDCCCHHCHLPEEVVALEENGLIRFTRPRLSETPAVLSWLREGWGEVRLQRRDMEGAWGGCWRGAGVARACPGLAAR